MWHISHCPLWHVRDKTDWQSKIFFAKLDSRKRAEGYIICHAKRDESGPDNAALSLFGGGGG
jgi:hypothetical protein